MWIRFEPEAPTRPTLVICSIRFFEQNCGYQVLIVQYIFSPSLESKLPLRMYYWNHDVTVLLLTKNLNWNSKWLLVIFKKQCNFIHISNTLKEQCEIKLYKNISHFLILRKKCFVKLYHFSQECLSLKLASWTFGRKSRKWLFLQKSSSCQLYYVKISLQRHPLATVNHSQFNKVGHWKRILL